MISVVAVTSLVSFFILLVGIIIKRDILSVVIISLGMFSCLRIFSNEIGKFSTSSNGQLLTLILYIVGVGYLVTLAIIILKSYKFNIHRTEDLDMVDK